MQLTRTILRKHQQVGTTQDQPPSGVVIEKDQHSRSKAGMNCCNYQIKLKISPSSQCFKWPRLIWKERRHVGVKSAIFLIMRSLFLVA